MALYGYSFVGLIDHPCRARLTEPPNPAFAFNWGPFILDNLSRPAPRVILRGDSTLAYSGLTVGWTDGHNRAVAGNTACDMIQQLPAAPGGTPEAVLLASYGGNDLLHGYSEDIAVLNMIDLIDQTRAHWPGARIVGIGIHPTRALSLGSSPCEVNARVRKHLLSLADTCDVDPYPVFNKTCGELADVDQMLPGDVIHYNPRMGALLKKELFDRCGLRLSVD